MYDSRIGRWLSVDAEYFTFGTYMLNVNGKAATNEGRNMSNAILIGNYTRSGISYTYNDNRSNNPENGYGKHIGQPSDDIYYKLMIGSAANLKTTLCGSDFDTYIYLLNQEGTIIQSNYDNGVGCATH